MASSVRIPLFNLGAPAYDLLTSHRYWREHIARFLDFLPPSANRIRVLDLGCGPGVSTFVLASKLGPEASLVGIDLAPRMIARARRHHERRFPELTNVRFEQADATELPFDGDSFDLAVGHSFLYLVSDRAAVLREVHRVLAKRGTLVLMEPNKRASLPRVLGEGMRRWPTALRNPLDTGRFISSMIGWRMASTTAGHMTSAELERAFEQAGFDDVSCQPTLAGLGLHCVGRVE